MIKLIACDMDGTLLDSQKRLPMDFSEVLAALKEKGVLFAVASGRQYAALRRDFEPYIEDVLFICENGALLAESKPFSCGYACTELDLERMLAERGLRAGHENGQAHFYVSDVPDSFVQTADLFLGEYKGGPVEQIAIDKY